MTSVTSELTEEEIASLEKYANEFLLGLARTAYAHSTIMFFVMGLQCFMCVYGLQVHLETASQSRKGRIPYIVLSWIVFGTSASATLLTGVAPIPYLAKFTPAKVEDILPGGSLYEEGLLSGSTLKRWSYISNSLQFIWVQCLGDGMMLYRCFIIWNDIKWVLVLPSMIYLFSFGTGIYNIVHDPKGTSETILANIKIFASTIFNILATLLIVYRLTRWRKKLSIALPSRRLSVYSGAVAILIESGLPLAFFGVATSILHLVVSSDTTLQDDIMSPAHTAKVSGALVVTGFYKAFTIISPQLVIFRVTMGRSFTNKDEVVSTLTRNHGRRPVPKEIH
ncbi:hypothetical protein FA15DRAFT_706925 [Coprinopsis marcescibilis]|uniref:Uncharacterized protein n=1 Tax=Coprinopsis marcescibilis TaxID=230819 RepID=A0A5C3KMT3_COPMA|nr:hypothetical protein FA15DRAFT_706925 [Coprinopsis marcescibilis]